MKNYLLLVTFILASVSVNAQLSGGVRLGVNLSNQKIESGSDSETGDMKLGFLGGLYLTANLSEKFAVQPELLFSGMGSQDNDADIKLPFNYLSVPVLLRYNVSENINLHAGPQIGFLLSAKVTDGNDSVDIKESFTGTDFGAAFGIGGDFGKFNGGLRYYLGMSNIAEDAADNESFKNNAFQIFLGYRLFGGE
jgi:hypothetical protein